MNETVARPTSSLSVWPMFSGLFIALALLLAAVLLAHYYVDYRAERTRRDAAQSVGVKLALRALEADIGAITTDLMFLARHIESLSFEPAADAARRRYLAELFLTFSREKGLYDHIRFIDSDGREVVRVNRAGRDRVLVDNAGLQDKSDRYYVVQGQRLQSGQVYLSPLDLNVEDGAVEQPIKPVLRFVTPVFDAGGRHQGLVVLNYLGDLLLAGFRQATADIADHVHLLNDEGYWLSSPQPDEAWGFMFGRNDDTFALRFPDAWRRISTQQAGQFASADGFFTFATIVPVTAAAEALARDDLPGVPGESWKVVSRVELDLAALGLGSFFARYTMLYLGVLALLGVLAYLLASANLHRRAAETERSHERRFRQTLEDIGLAALMVDLRGSLTFCNGFLLQLTGWRPEEVIGSDWIDRFVPDDEQAAVRAVLTRLARDGEFPAAFEGEVRTRSGGRRLIAWNNTLTRDARGRIIGLTAIGEDITERRHAETEVRKLSQAVHQSPAIVLITDRAGRIEYANPKFTAVTGYTLDEVRGRNPRLLKSGETPPDEYRRLWTELAAGGEWRGEFHNCRKDGALYWESALISALRGADGEISHFLAVKEDITERKRLEQEVESRNRELARVQVLAAMGQMASMLAHDLRNPLSSIKMAVQILGKQVAGEEARELAAIGQEQVHYMEDIITDMLTFSRPGELRLAWLSAEKLLNATIGTVRRRIDEYGAEVTVDCAPGLPTFPADASRLRQLLSNLLVNALQASATHPAGKRQVHVSAELGQSAVGRIIRIHVCDNGDGIDPLIQNRLFEPFFTTRTKGTGLGLAIVRQIADLHGGTVELTPNQPAGTCAVVTLPVTPVVEGGSVPQDEQTKGESA